MIFLYKYISIKVTEQIIIDDSIKLFAANFKVFINESKQGRKNTN